MTETSTTSTAAQPSLQAQYSKLTADSFNATIQEERGHLIDVSTSSKSASCTWVLPSLDTQEPFNHFRSPKFQFNGHKWALHLRKTFQNRGFDLYLSYFKPYQLVFDLEAKFALSVPSIKAPDQVVFSNTIAEVSMDPTVHFVTMYSKYSGNRVPQDGGSNNIVSGRLDNVKLRPAYEHQHYCGYGWKDFIRPSVPFAAGCHVAEPVHIKIIIKEKRSRSYQKLASVAELQQLSNPVRVGRVQVTVKYNWNINPALFVLDDEVVEFWKSLKDMKKKKHGFQLSPVDIVKYFKGHMLTIDSSFADSVRRFIVKAIHIQVNGWVTVPYDIVFHEYDVDDGSGDDKDFNMFIGGRFKTVLLILDRCILTLLPESYRKSKSIKKDICSKCKCQGDSFKNCSKCLGVKYCSRDCQVADWSAHKIKCNDIRLIHEKMMEERRKVQNESPEEALNRYLQKRGVIDQEAVEEGFNMDWPPNSSSSSSSSSTPSDGTPAKEEEPPRRPWPQFRSKQKVGVQHFPLSTKKE